jgi:hypothetical protein
MKDGVGARRETPLPLVRALWAVAVLLVAIGVGAAIGRSIFPDDFVTRAEPVRQWLVETLRREDPLALARPAELAKMDGRFAAHPILTRLHVILGGLFLLVAPLQFSTRMRARHIAVHRWSGRILLPALFMSLLPGLYFGLLIPYGGPGEAVAIAVFGGALLFSACRAYLAIRRHQVALHREWMIRVFAIAIAISTVRMAGAVIDFTLSPFGFRPANLFVLSVWTGWILTVAGAEGWIRYTRPRPPFPAVAERR